MILFSQLKLGYAQSTVEIVGNWVVDADKTFDSMDTKKKMRFDSMPLTKRQDIKQSFQGRVFHLYTDSRAEISFSVLGNSKLIQGAWSYSIESKRLLISADGKSSKYIVQWIDNNHLKFIFTGYSTQGLLQSLFLARNN